MTAPGTQPAPASGEGEALHDCPEAQAWRDNYDGMFWRWAECDAERLRLMDALRHAELRLRIAEQNAALGGEQAGDGGREGK